MMNIEGIEEKEEQNVNVAPSTKAREAYFLDFAKAMQEVVTVPLMVTGGFRTKAAMEYALESGGADVIGIGRPLCCMTDGAKKILAGTIDALPRYEDDRDLFPDYLAFLKRFQLFKMVNAFAAIFWYYEQLESLGETGKVASIERAPRSRFPPCDSPCYLPGNCQRIFLPPGQSARWP